MKYLFLFLIITATNSFAQDYKTQLATHREKYKADFLSDAHSPLKQEDLKNLHFYDADSTYAVNASIQLLFNEPTFKMPTFNGSSAEYVRFAFLKFTLKGKPMQLTLYKSISLSQIPEYQDYLFLPFTDETNSKETYGGGRYIDLRYKDAKDGHIQLDFNKAYNPYCAYSAGYHCPVPPQANDMPVKIEAGEMQYTGEKMH